jgi:hypothetical protein
MVDQNPTPLSKNAVAGNSHKNYRKKQIGQPRKEHVTRGK